MSETVFSTMSQESVLQQQQQDFAKITELDGSIGATRNLFDFLVFKLASESFMVRLQHPLPTHTHTHTHTIEEQYIINNRMKSLSRTMIIGDNTSSCIFPQGPAKFLCKIEQNCFKASHHHVANRPFYRLNLLEKDTVFCVLISRPFYESLSHQLRGESALRKVSPMSGGNLY